MKKTMKIRVLREPPCIARELRQEESVEHENGQKLGPLEPRDLALAANLEVEDEWRVEYFDTDGAC